jgi:hypothetical protein
MADRRSGVVPSAGWRSAQSASRLVRSGLDQLAYVPLRQERRRLVLPMKTIIVVLVGLVINLAVARAHMSDRGQDYSSYFQHNGGSCCNQSDCQPVRYEFTPNGRLIMYPQGRAVEIAPALINPKPSMDGNAHWCGRSLLAATPETLCAILPPRSAHQRHPPVPPWMHDHAVHRH